MPTSRKRVKTKRQKNEARKRRQVRGRVVRRGCDDGAFPLDLALAAMLGPTLSKPRDAVDHRWACGCYVFSGNIVACEKHRPMRAQG